MCCVAIVVKMHSCFKGAAIHTFHIIKRGRSVRAWKTAPCPITEILFQSAGAEVGIEIALSVPLPTIALQIHGDIRNWRKGAPDVAAICF